MVAARFSSSTTTNNNNKKKHYIFLYIKSHGSWRPNCCWQNHNVDVYNEGDNWHTNSFSEQPSRSGQQPAQQQQKQQ